MYAVMIFQYSMGVSWRLLLPLKISLFQAGNPKIRINSKNLMSPEPLIFRAKTPPAKRSEKGYGDENASHLDRLGICRLPLRWPASL